MAKIKTYVGSKIIQGISMDHHTFLKNEKGKSPAEISEQENQAGYRVIYPDGYVSWSPANVFESAYREITGSEKAML